MPRVEPPVDGLGRDTGKHFTQLLFVVGCRNPYGNRTRISPNDPTLRIDLRPLTVGLSCPFMNQILHLDLFSRFRSVPLIVAAIGKKRIGQKSNARMGNLSTDTQDIRLGSAKGSPLPLLFYSPSCQGVFSEIHIPPCVSLYVRTGQRTVARPNRGGRQ